MKYCVTKELSMDAIPPLESPLDKLGQNKESQLELFVLVLKLMKESINFKKFSQKYS